MQIGSGRNSGVISMSDTTPNPRADLDLLWGAPRIAAFLGQTKRATYHLLEGNKIPARKVGGSWVASKAKLAAFFEEVQA